MELFIQASIIAILLGNLAAIQSFGLTPTNTKRTESEVFYFFRESQSYADAEGYCKGLEGDLYPKRIDKNSTKRVELMKTVTWFWAGSSSEINASDHKKLCPVARYMPHTQKIGMSNVSCTSNPYPFLCRIPFGAGNNGTSCGKGYQTLRSGRCLDINECTDRVACRGYLSKCENLPGTYECHCPNDMQGNGLDACGYPFFISHIVDSEVFRYSGKHKWKHHGAIQNRLQGMIRSRAISKIIIINVTSSIEKNTSDIVIYEVYARKKYYKPEQFKQVFMERKRLLKSAWLSKWKELEPVSDKCPRTLIRFVNRRFIFEEVQRGRLARTSQRCHGTDQPRATIKCRLRRRYNGAANTTFLDYKTLSVTNCSAIKMDSPPALENNSLPVIQETSPSINITEAPHYPSTTVNVTHTTSAELEETTWKSTTIHYPSTTVNVTHTTSTELEETTGKSAAKPIADYNRAPNLEDMLGKFVQQLKTNATFRASKEAFDFGKNLLMDSIKRATTDESAQVSSSAMGYATVMLDWLIENPGSVFISDEEKTDLAFSFEKLPAKVNLGNDSHFTMDTKMISLEVAQVDPEKDSTVSYDSGASNANSTSQPAKAFLPSDVADMISEAKNSTGAFNAGFLLYKNTSLFSVQSEDDDKPELSKVLSATVPLGKPVRNLSELFWYQIPIADENSKKKTLHYFKCSFLNETTRNWSTEGCFYTPGSFPPNCSCDHLTNFALLVKNVEMLDQFALGIFGKIACSISVLSLLWMLGSYMSGRNLRRNKINQIHINLGLSLLSAYLVFLVGVERTEYKKGCMAVAALLHFFLLSTWGWMVVEAITMYRKLVMVFSKMQSSYIIKCAVCVYLTSLIIVTLTISITIIKYDKTYMTEWDSDTATEELFNSFYVSERLCWLRGIPLYLSFLAPVALSIFINFTAFARITKAITCDRRKVHSSRRTTKVEEAKSYLIRASAISFVMGLTWIFAVPLAVTDDPSISAVFSWLFSIFNALQGFFIFLFFCAKRKDVREIWASAFRSRMSTVSRLRGKTEDGLRSPTTYRTHNLSKHDGNFVIKNIAISSD